MKGSRFTEEQIIGMLREQLSAPRSVISPASAQVMRRLAHR
jgi:hypothetical protein